MRSTTGREGLNGGQEGVVAGAAGVDVVVVVVVGGAALGRLSLAMLGCAALLFFGQNTQNVAASVSVPLVTSSSMGLCQSLTGSGVHCGRIRQSRDQKEAGHTGSSVSSLPQLIDTLLRRNSPKSTFHVNNFHDFQCKSGESRGCGATKAKSSCHSPVAGSRGSTADVELIAWQRLPKYFQLQPHNSTFK